MSLNYFTKTKDCLQIRVVGCLTPSPHVTRPPNSRIKIFYLSTLDQEKRPFSQPRIDNKIKQIRVTNHTVEKPNDWWQLHLTLEISLKLTYIPVTHSRYNLPPQHPNSKLRMHVHASYSRKEKHASITAMGGRTTVRHQQAFQNNFFFLLNKESTKYISIDWLE